jgi:hypothetical protein
MLGKAPGEPYVGGVTYLALMGSPDPYPTKLTGEIDHSIVDYQDHM